MGSEGDMVENKVIRGDFPGGGGVVLGEVDILGVDGSTYCQVIEMLIFFVDDEVGGSFG